MGKALTFLLVLCGALLAAAAEPLQFSGSKDGVCTLKSDGKIYAASSHLLKFAAPDGKVTAISKVSGKICSILAVPGGIIAGSNTGEIAAFRRRSNLIRR